MKTVLSATVSAVLIGVTLCATEAPAMADNGHSFTVDWSTYGVQAYSAPDTNSTPVGGAFANGSTVLVTCETLGTPVSNGLQTTNIWEKLAGTGAFVPNANTNTGADGFTPGVPSCESLKKQQPTPDPETPKKYDGMALSDGTVSINLYNHYYDRSGKSVILDWSYFEGDRRLVGALKSLKGPGEYEIYNSNPVDDGDIFWALGRFEINQTSEHCYIVADKYDFDVKGPYATLAIDAQLGAAKPFEVRSSGCLNS